MQEEARIPFLPGNSFRDISKQDFRKVHTLDYLNGYAVKKTPKLSIGLEPIELEPEFTTEQLLSMVGTNPKLTYGDKQYHATPLPPRFVPAHVAYDKVVLRFDAFFKETVHESVEQYHLRKVKIYYFLEDDTIAVVEPPVENSGIPQKVFIKRQRLPKGLTVEPNEGEPLPATVQGHYNIRDFNLGINITFYGRTFRIVGCDKFTENYMTQTEKVALNSPEAMPTDPYVQLRNRPRRDYTVPSICPSIRHNDKLKKFLDHDRSVLRFYCIWDDRSNMFGELREFIAHYYLVDDCIEVREVPKPNNGRDPFPILLRKQKLQNPSSNGSDKKAEYYTWEDLYVGAVIFVLGRPFLIRNCDDATRRYYKENHPDPNLPMSPISYTSDDGPKFPIEHDVPPYNGFGTIEDSLGSCKYLVLKPPKKDFIKMLENDHKVLRFVAKMESTRREDQLRRFVISYRLADDHMTIYEPPLKNTGIIGGKFLERTKVIKPECFSKYSSVTPLGMSSTPEYYTAKDLFIGARIVIHHHKFILLDADEYVFNYMETRPDEFTFSNGQQVLQFARVCAQEAVGGWNRSGVEQKLNALDRTGTGKLDRRLVLETIRSCWSERLNDHCIITLCRQYEDKYRQVDYKKLFATL